MARALVSRAFLLSGHGRRAFDGDLSLCRAQSCQGKTTTRARAWPYSSTAAIIAKKSDKYVDVAEANIRIKDFGKFIIRENNVESVLWNEIRRHEFTGRPVGTKEWLENLDRELGGTVLPQKRGRKARLKGESKGS
jgi:putative transposase